jgi:hypothetical protein
MEVMEGWERQRFSTPLPIRPVEPVRMTFMVFQLFDLGAVQKVGGGSPDGLLRGMYGNATAA